MQNKKRCDQIFKLVNANPCIGRCRPNSLYRCKSISSLHLMWPLYVYNALRDGFRKKGNTQLERGVSRGWKEEDGLSRIYTRILVDAFVYANSVITYSQSNNTHTTCVYFCPQRRYEMCVNLDPCLSLEVCVVVICCSGVPAADYSLDNCGGTE